jgi:hypothetical protein
MCTIMTDSVLSAPPCARRAARLADETQIRSAVRAVQQEVQPPAASARLAPGTHDIHREPAPVPWTGRPAGTRSVWSAIYPPRLSGPANASASLAQDALPVVPPSDSASLVTDSPDECAPECEGIWASARTLEPTIRPIVPGTRLESRDAVTDVSCFLRARTAAERLLRCTR